MRTKKRLFDIVIGVVVMYLFLGLGIVTVQALSGTKCSPVRVGGDYVYSINANASRFWLVRTVQWLPTAWENVVEGDVSVADFISPKKCLWVPVGKTPAEVLEGEANRRQRRG